MSCAFTTVISRKNRFVQDFVWHLRIVSIRIFRIYGKVGDCFLSTAMRRVWVIFKRGSPPNQTSGKHWSKETWLKKPDDLRFPSFVLCPECVFLGKYETLSNRVPNTISPVAGGHSSASRDDVYGQEAFIDHFPRSLPPTPESTATWRFYGMQPVNASKTISRTRQFNGVSRSASWNRRNRRLFFFIFYTFRATLRNSKIVVRFPNRRIRLGGKKQTERLYEQNDNSAETGYQSRTSIYIRSRCTDIIRVYVRGRVNSGNNNTHERYYWQAPPRFCAIIIFRS